MKTDRKRVMRDAHTRFRQGKRLGMGWSFSQCLKTSWAAERIRRDERVKLTEWPLRNRWIGQKPMWGMRHAA